MVYCICTGFYPFNNATNILSMGNQVNNGNNTSNTFMKMAIQRINCHIFSIIILKYPSYPELSEQISLLICDRTLNYTRRKIISLFANAYAMNVKSN